MILGGIRIKAEHCIDLWNMKNIHIIGTGAMREKLLKWMAMCRNCIVHFQKEI